MGRYFDKSGAEQPGHAADVREAEDPAPGREAGPGHLRLDGRQRAERLAERRRDRVPAEALAAVDRERVDGAILDINLGGEMAYPLASVLHARKVPFVFMTGYGADAVATPFPGVRVFQKPLERDMLRSLFAADAPSSARVTKAAEQADRRNDLQCEPRIFNNAPSF